MGYPSYVRALRILITGGTIDNLEYSWEEDDPRRTNSVIPMLLKQAKITVPVETEILMLKDGRFITDEDRDAIVRRCQEAAEQCIVITHGTTTLSVTARYLGDRLKEKTIVLTGAMVMPENANSDASFNLGYAIAAAQHLPAGVYLAMNGRIFSWDNVQKNEKLGIFTVR